MIHPSTMAGPNWFTGSIGTTNPFQTTGSPFFRNTPFQGPSGGFGPGTNPFQNQPFGFGGTPTPIQNMINEIVSRTVPTTLASFGIPSPGFQTPFGPQGSFGFPNPWNLQIPTGPSQFGLPFQTSNWLNPSFFSEIIRQSTNQAFQNPWQPNTTSFSPFQSSTTSPFFGFGPTPTSPDLTNLIGQICQQACQQVSATLIQAVTTCVNECLNTQNTSFGTPTAFGTNWQQQNLGNFVGQVSQQACQAACQTLCQAVITCVNETLNSQSRSSNIPLGAPTGFGINPQQQNLWNLCAQICQQACQQVSTTLCQAVATCVNECLNAQTRTPGTPFFNTTNIPFRTPGTPFTFSNATSQYGTLSGIPTGAGAF